MSDSDTTIDWSYTNAQLYSSCPRSLFYHYWHRKGASTSDENNLTSEQVWRSAPGALVGTAVHEAISTQIDRLATGRNTNHAEALDTAREYIRSTEIAGPTQATNGEENETDSLIRTAEDHVERFLSVIWPQLRTGRYITHEITYSFESDGATIWVRPDLCHRNSNGRFVITDWKTRQPNLIEDTTLQLQAYALWALQEFEPELERIKLQLAFTSTGEIKPQPLNPDSIASLRTRIKKDTTAWEDPNDQSRFPAEPATEKCQKCSYLPSCGTGQKTLK